MSTRRKRYTEDFKREAMRLVEESGLTQQEIAGDLGIGKSTLGKWLGHYREEDLLAGPHEDMGKDFTAVRPNEKWVADISYIWTQGGWLYLAVIIDLYARRVVGWATGDRLHLDLTLGALKMALVRRRPTPGLIHHSDRGSQYASWEYQKTLKAHGILISMSGKGNCYDNAAVESFFKTIKSELVWRTKLLSRRQANDMIAKYIEGFYNPERRH